ncbi:hypothetical protein ACQ4PT_058182 [Festuca glaucescens]
MELEHDVVFDQYGSSMSKEPPFLMSNKLGVGALAAVGDTSQEGSLSDSQTIEAPSSITLTLSREDVGLEGMAPTWSTLTSGAKGCDKLVDATAPHLEMLSTESELDPEAPVTDLRKEVNDKAAVVRGKRSKAVPVGVARKSARNKGDKASMTALNKAKLRAAEKNLDKEIDQDLVSGERNNVLHLAAEQGHTELIQELYKSFGGDVVRSLLSSRNSAMETPLHCAARAGHDMVVTLLVQLARGCGEDTISSCKNKAGDTALHLAARLGHDKAVEALVNATPELASEVNDAGVSPLYLAVMRSSEAAMRAITSSCIDASAAGPSSQNALHAAVFEGKRPVVDARHNVSWQSRGSCY